MENVEVHIEQVSIPTTPGAPQVDLAGLSWRGILDGPLILPDRYSSTRVK